MKSGKKDDSGAKVQADKAEKTTNFGEKASGDGELDPRFAATVKRMLDTPPKPHKRSKTTQ